MVINESSRVLVFDVPLLFVCSVYNVPVNINQALLCYTVDISFLHGLEQHYLTAYSGRSTTDESTSIAEKGMLLLIQSSLCPVLYYYCFPTLYIICSFSFAEHCGVCIYFIQECI